MCRSKVFWFNSVRTLRQTCTTKVIGNYYSVEHERNKYADPVEVAGALALQKVLEASHRHVKRVDGIEAKTRRCVYYVGIMRHQTPLLVLPVTRKPTKTELYNSS